MNEKKFATLQEFFNSEEYKNKDLSYCDLSNLDLSHIDNWIWGGFKFFYTNFKNTNIKFFPRSLRLEEQDIVFLNYCDFTGCDLSYLRSKDFENVSIKGSCFLETKLDIRLYNVSFFEKTIFPLEMTDFLIYSSSLEHLSLLELNSHLFFSSLSLNHFLNRFYNSIKGQFLTQERMELYSENIKKTLEIDKKNEGYLNRLFWLLGGESFSIMDVINFSGNCIYSKTYETVDFSSFPFELMENFEFYDCKFECIIMSKDALNHLSQFDLGLFAIYDEERDRPTSIPHIIIPGLNGSSWQEYTLNRFGVTCFTKLTNLYLELGRYCNAHCFFCRNQYLEPCKYDLKAILENLKRLLPFLNHIVIGGGEPMLILKDLDVVLNSLDFPSRKFFISTNGSCGYENLARFARHFNINLSRHALTDSDNDCIFGVQTIRIEEIKELIETFYRTTFTLVATCFKGGLDHVSDLEQYIELSDYVGSNVLFQTLHEDLKDGEPSVQIDDGIFDEVITHLKEQGYKVGEVPIYSTGDYKLIIVKSKNEEKTISFKKYITKEELEKEWYRASKRTFDLSMAPNGDVYENWHQTSNLVLSRKK